ncbi:MAG: response regulator [Elusimicrobia bacterium]|nr:response regulator [Elusimicrobiota bacterium]
MAKILIVDDEGSIRMLFRCVFEDAGHEVAEAENGAVALASIQAGVPDAMLLDVAMPEMTGPELAAQLRKLASRRPELRNIPYMVLTGENYMIRGAEFGFEEDPKFGGYLPKMTPPEDILAKLQELLGAA